MPDASEVPSLRARDTRITSPSERRWTPIYPVYAKGDMRKGQRISNSLPIDWICPCVPGGTRLMGNKTCPKCGRSPMDGGRVIDVPQHIAHSRDDKRWRKFGRRY